MPVRLGTSASRHLLRSSRAPTPVTPSLLCRLRPYPSLPRTLQPAQLSRRCAHSIPKPPSPTDPATGKAKARVKMEPHYELTFTCVPCGERSSHTISKQGYHHGSVLITCPSCRNRHVISDHMNIFGDRQITIEDLMRERGQLVKRGTLGEDGDVEFWEDGTTTARGDGSGISPVARDLQTPAQADQTPASHEARDPSTQAAGPSHTPSGASSPLGAHGTRPRIDTHTSTTPSTRRQMSDLPKTHRYRTARTLASDKYQEASLRSYLRQIAGSNLSSRLHYNVGNEKHKVPRIKGPAVPRRVASNAPSWFPTARKREEEEEYRSMATKTKQMPRDMLVKGKVSLAWDKRPSPRPTWETDGFNRFRKVGTSFDPRPHYNLPESKPADPTSTNYEELSSPMRQLRSARADEECHARKEKQRAKEAERLEKGQVELARKGARRQGRRDKIEAPEDPIVSEATEPSREPPNTAPNGPTEETLGMGSNHPSSGLGASEAAAMGEGESCRQKQQQQPGHSKMKPFRRAIPTNRARASQIEASAVYAWPKGASKPVKIISRKATREPISPNASF